MVGRAIAGIIKGKTLFLNGGGRYLVEGANFIKRRYKFTFRE